MTETSPEMRAYMVEYQRRYSPLIADFEAILKHALRNDAEFDATSPVVVRGIQPKPNGAIKLVPIAELMVGRPKPQLEGSWTPDRQLLSLHLVKPPADP